MSIGRVASRMRREDRRSSPRPPRRSGPGRGPIERLEGRDIPAVVVAAVAATEGVAFRGVVASFQPADVTGPGALARAQIDWGDGHTTAGVISANGSGGFDVAGANTYAIQGQYPVAVTITGTDNGNAIGRGTADVADAPLTTFPKTITPVAGQQFAGRVASFVDAYPGLGPSDYRATIDWGDGHTSLGTVVRNNLGGFDVVGSNIYGAQGQDTVGVMIIRALDGQTATADGKALVVNAYSFSGQLDPLDDTGASNSDGITNNNQPAFVGTSEPFAIVWVFARRTDLPAPVPLGQTVAGADGRWRFVAGPLLDGAYMMTAIEIPPGGSPRPAVALGPTGLVVIDTVAPRVVGLSADPRAGEVTAVFQDQGGGMDPQSLANPANYTVFGPRLRGLPILGVDLVPAQTFAPNVPRGVTLRVGHPSRRAVALNSVRILSGGVADLAGNALDGESRGGLPSGDGLPGGDFRARLGAHRRPR